jgi:hypothetical protein
MLWLAIYVTGAVNAVLEDGQGQERPRLKVVKRGKTFTGGQRVLKSSLGEFEDVLI